MHHLKSTFQKYLLKIDDQSNRKRREQNKRGRIGKESVEGGTKVVDIEEIVEIATGGVEKDDVAKTNVEKDAVKDTDKDSEAKEDADGS